MSFGYDPVVTNEVKDSDDPEYIPQAIAEANSKAQIAADIEKLCNMSDADVLKACGKRSDFDMKQLGKMLAALALRQVEKKRN